MKRHADGGSFLFALMANCVTTPDWNRLKEANVMTGTFAIKTWWLTAFVILVTSLATVSAQGTGGIRGRVTDNEFDTPVNDAVVQVLETDAETKTVDGHFSFQGLKPGAYTVLVMKRGYQRVLRNDVVVTPGAMADIRIELPGEYVEMDQFVVRPLQLGGASEVGLLNLRAQDLGIMDAVGTELMSRAGAGSAAEAIKLVSGASVQGGKYAVIRGLSDRFVNTRVNGVPMPTADPDVRAVQLDLFPSAVLESIRVHKTFTPDLPANTSGGSIDIVTSKMPTDLVLDFKAGVSYNSQATGNDDFLTSGEGVTYFGLDEGAREQTLQNGEVVTPATGARGGDSPFINNPPWTEAERADARLLDKQTRSLSGTMGTSETTASPDHSWGLAYGDRWEPFEDLAVGWLGTATYKNSYSYYADGQDQFRVGRNDLSGFEIPVESGEANENPDPDQWKVRSGTEKVRWGVGGLLGLETGGHSVSLSYLRTQNTEDEASVLYDDETSEKVYWHNQSLIYTDRSLESLQLRGETPLSFLPEYQWRSLTLQTPKLNWSLAENEAVQNQPDRRFFLAAFNPRTNQWGPPRKPKNFAERSWRQIVEENEYYQLDMTLPFTLQEELEGEVKAGLSENDTNRSYTQDSFFYDLPPTSGTLPPFFDGVEGSASSPAENYIGDSFEDLWTDVFLEPRRLGYPPPIGEGYEFGQSYFGDDVLENEVNWVIQEFADDVDYIGKLNVSAEYVMAKIPVRSWLTVVGGVRWEETILATDVDAADGNDGEAKVLNVRVDPNTPDFISADSINQADPQANMTLDKLANANINQQDVLPSLGLVIEPFENIKLRGTWSRTIGRPTFKEITPVKQQDHLNGQKFAGNPDLKISSLENYDLRLEWMPGAGQVLSASAFYKDIEDPIDYAQRPAAGSTPFVIPFNFEKGEVLGAEFEIRQNLANVADWLGWLAARGSFGLWEDPELGEKAGWLGNFSIGGNATFLQATVSVPDRDVRKIEQLLSLRGKDPNDFEVDERRMKDQPENIFNLYLLYENEKTGSSAGIFWNHKGETLLAGEDANSDDYIANRVAKAHSSLNVSFSQEFWKHWKLSLKAENILNPEVEEVWQSDYIPSEAVASTHTEGVTYSLSLAVKW